MQTPLYQETVVFSKSELEKVDANGDTLLSFLQSTSPHEWDNFCERIGVPANMWMTPTDHAADEAIESTPLAAHSPQPGYGAIPDPAGADSHAARQGLPGSSKSSSSAPKVSLGDMPAEMLKQARERHAYARTPLGPCSLPRADAWAPLPCITQVRLWSSYRGQTLARTVRGMAQYEAALLFQVGLEMPHLSAEQARELVRSKMELIVAAQCYSDQRKANDPKAADLELVMATFPCCKVVCLDTVVKQDDGGDGSCPPTFASVLLHVDDQGGVIEQARVELPGMPILGEGKPENQNLALPFVRAERVFMVDMNQVLHDVCAGSAPISSCSAHACSSSQLQSRT